MDNKSRIPLRVLWIGRINSSDRSGEVLYDRNISEILRENCTLIAYEPPPIGFMKELWTLVTGQVIYRGRFNTKRTVETVRKLAQTVDVVVCSWEPYDFLVDVINKPVVLILHNITSMSIKAIYPKDLLRKFLSARAAKYEKVAYRSKNIHAIITLSKLDKAAVEGFVGTRPILWVPPGAPKSVGLSESATFLPKLALSGTYGWSVKRRDLGLFLDDVRNEKVTITSDDRLPERCLHGMTIMKAHFDDRDYCESHIRLGVIPDRFVSGHKLKGTFFIANNAIILSYADIRDEFAGLPDAYLFVRIINGTQDIKDAIDIFSKMPAEELRKRFVEFKSACLERFQWNDGGNTLWNAVEDAARRTS